MPITRAPKSPVTGTISVPALRDGARRRRHLVGDDVRGVGVDEQQAHRILLLLDDRNASSKSDRAVAAADRSFSDYSTWCKVLEHERGRALGVVRFDRIDQVAVIVVGQAGTPCASYRMMTRQVSDSSSRIVLREEAVAGHLGDQLMELARQAE